jgi:hypothetical protein
MEGISKMEEKDLDKAKATEKVDFNELKARILKRMKYGDGIDIARRANVTYRVWRDAVAKNSWEELTGGETKVIMAAIAFFRERDELIEYAENL